MLEIDEAKGQPVEAGTDGAAYAVGMLVDSAGEPPVSLAPHYFSGVPIRELAKGNPVKIVFDAPGNPIDVVVYKKPKR